MDTAPSRHDPAGPGDVISHDSPPESLVGTPLRLGTNTASPSVCLSPSAATTAGGADVPAAFAARPTSAFLPQHRRVAEQSLKPGVDLGNAFDSAAAIHEKENAADGHLGEHRSDAKYMDATILS